MTAKFKNVAGLMKTFSGSIGLNADKQKSLETEFSQSMQDKASLYAAIEAKRSRKLAKDLVLHVIFFSIFITIVLLQRDVDAVNDITDSIYNSLITQEIDYKLSPFPKSYLDIGQWEEYRDYLVGQLGPTVSNAELYSNESIPAGYLHNVENVNRIVGAIRVRQLRVASDSCVQSSKFAALTPTCYNKKYMKSTKDREPFGPPSDPTKYKYTSDSGGVRLLGYTNVGFYDASGYVVDIPVDENTTARFQELIDDTFWNAGTRAIIISINLVSGNYDDRSTVLYLLSEFTAGGIVNPYVVTRTFRTTMYTRSLDYFRAFLEIVYLIFLIYYVFSLVRDFIVDYQIGRVKQFILNLWNLVEFSNLILLFIATIMYLNYLGSKRGRIDFTRTDYIVDLEHLGKNAIEFYQIAAINILLLAFRSFKYLQLNPRLYVLWDTLYGARFDLATYMVMFIIILLGFLFFGWLTFGPDLEYFNGFVSSLGTLWQFLIGNPPEYGDLQESNRILGPLYFSLFTIFVFFILVNMFVAIVGNSYENIAERAVAKQQGSGGVDLKKPLKRVMRMAKAVVQRKPLYSETDLLRMLRNRSLLEKTNITRAELEAELVAMGEEPLTLYIERLLEIHAKRRKYLLEMAEEESKRREAEAEDEYDRRVDAHQLGGVSIELTNNNSEVSSSSEIMLNGLHNKVYTSEGFDDAGSAMSSTAVAGLEAKLERLVILEERMERMNQKLDLLLSKMK